MQIGIDIEEVKRFNALIKNKRFLKRVFTTQEIDYCNSKKNRAQHFAVRFAAKEAVWKALSDVIHFSKIKIAHTDIGVKNSLIGKPAVTLPKRLARLNKKLVISLSHTHSQAVAVAIVKD